MLSERLKGLTAEYEKKSTNMDILQAKLNYALNNKHYELKVAHERVGASFVHSKNNFLPNLPLLMEHKGT